MLDFAQVRAQFPGLQTDWTLFDNAGGSVPCRQVVDRVHEYLTQRCVQLGGSYALSDEATRAVEDGRAAVAQLIHAEPNEVVLGPSSTMLTRTLGAALRPLLSPGDEVVVTNLDHETNRTAWLALAEHGVVLREWRFDPETMRLEPEGLDAVLSERTRLVCFTHTSNIVGTIHDAAPLVRKVHDAGALACMDGVAYGPHRRIDVRALDVDFYFASLYKIYGPHMSFLYGKHERLRELRSQNHFFFAESDVPDKLEPGAPTHELAASLRGIVDYLTSLDDGDPGRSVHERLNRAFELIAETESAVAAPLLSFLDEHPRVRIIGSADPGSAHRAPTIAFAVEGRKASEIPPLLDERKLAARWGHFYAYRLIEALDLLEHDGVIRTSLVHYNTPDEVERLIEALDEIL
ncbi:MAG: cysteine desulfurase-like protein [Planctomycetota bacterium]